MGVIVSAIFIVISLYLTHIIGEKSVKFLKDRNLNREVSWFAYAFSFIALFLVLRVIDHNTDLYISFFTDAVGVIGSLNLLYLISLLILKRFNMKWYQKFGKELERYDRNL
ncbi:hypothetical protein [Alteribacter aurantiacus]|uniref:hypothetical protein n=1 Tax=Alteribacter aurantiacus TaxID=254410 RepID=UPI00040AD0EF|nr:hypothetical protein [Alteribacter aurantiacus]